MAKKDNKHLRVCFAVSAFVVEVYFSILFHSFIRFFFCYCFSFNSLFYFMNFHQHKHQQLRVQVFVSKIPLEKLREIDKTK